MLPDFGCCHGLEALAERRKTLTRTDSLTNETPVAARVWASGRDRSTNDASDCVMLSQVSTEDGDSDGICAREGPAGAEPFSDGIRAHGAPAEECQIKVGDVVMFSDGKKGIVQQVILVSGEWVVQAMLDGEITRATTVRDLAGSASGELSDPEKSGTEGGPRALEEASANGGAKTAEGHAKGKAKAKKPSTAKSKAETKTSPKAKSKAGAKASPKAKSKAKAKAKSKAKAKAKSKAGAKGKRKVGTPANAETQGEDKSKARKLEDPEAYEKRKAYCRERNKILTLSCHQQPAADLTEKQEFFRDRILCRLCVESSCCPLRSSSEPLSSTIRSKNFSIPVLSGTSSTLVGPIEKGKEGGGIRFCRARTRMKEQEMKEEAEVRRGVGARGGGGRTRHEQKRGRAGSADKQIQRTRGNRK